MKKMIEVLKIMWKDHKGTVIKVGITLIGSFISIILFKFTFTHHYWLSFFIMLFVLVGFLKGFCNTCRRFTEVYEDVKNNMPEVMMIYPDKKK